MTLASFEIDSANRTIDCASSLLVFCMLTLPYFTGTIWGRLGADLGTIWGGVRDNLGQTFSLFQAFLAVGGRRGRNFPYLFSVKL